MNGDSWASERARPLDVRPVLRERKGGGDLMFGRKLKRSQQTCFVFCPICRLEQIANGCFVEDAELVRYRCVRCGTETDWLFDAPTPLLINTRPISEIPAEDVL